MEPEVEQTIQQQQGRGQALPESLRSSMEGAFGADFSGVRVHNDSEADALNDSMQARAFTIGHDIYLRQGEYNPGNSAGQELLAHELTHVVQQSSGNAKRGQSNRSVPSHPNPSEVQRGVDEHASVTEFRADLKGVFVPGIKNLAVGLKSLASSIADIKSISSTVNLTTDEAEFQREYAKYLSVQEFGDETHHVEKLENAKTQLADAKCRAFTNQKSEAWFFGATPELSDVIHEIVHILSAQGGQTKILADYGAGLNEGFTHMFTKMACGWNSIAVKAAYATETAFVEKLAAKYGTPLLYQAYFKDQMDSLVNAMVDTYEGYVVAGLLKDGKRPGWSEKGTDRAAKKVIVINKLKDWSTNGPWLGARIL